MAEKVDLSLDDIIKMSKSKKSQPRGRPKVDRLKNLGARSGIISRGATRQNPRQNVSAKKDREPTMLHVGNLAYQVSDQDLRELFAEVGFVKRAKVHYDKSGRSLGTAEVTFRTRDDAINAIKKYHKLPLDGRPMKITLVPSQVSIRSPTKRQPIKASQGGGQPVKRRIVNRGGKPNPHQRGPRQPKKQVTAEELDADLESYTMNVD